ncbi:hypothetical protein DBR40_21890 [Pedobacter sp. KBW01]|uniref:hypothetical protein n=1 Tax=Pedobacter sp. KBW01 TaxID=2153364 RepID=UPI000F5AC5AF|nr:hypothetical protein [Pedobacter sp. KBW01]RQO66805.1 hypothetical protein DBR40_21890 [Pedobacter sp. KBW01]
MTNSTTQVQAIYDKVVERHAEFRKAKEQAAKSAIKRAALATWKHMSKDTAFIVSVIAFGAAFIYTLITIITR